MGLTLAARLVSNPISKECYFGPGLRASGLLPVLLAIENRGQGSFDLKRSDIHLVLENGERFEPVPPADVFAEASRSSTAAILLAPLIVPAILLANDASDHNFELARALALKSLPRGLRIEPGDAPACRAVFYRDPQVDRRDPRAFESATLQLTIEREGERPREEGDVEGRAGITAAADANETVGRVLTFTLAVAREAFP